MMTDLQCMFAAMPGRAQMRVLDDGRRVHFNDGPIDLVIEADGEASEIASAYAEAALRFRHILDELCRELPLLRAAVRPGQMPADGVIARRMQAAVFPHATRGFITSMAAVAGAVAEDMVAIFARRPGIARAFVNNGGDIALHLTPGAHYRIALIDDPRVPVASAHAGISYESVVRGVATSGRHGRSFSLGIADAVTVLAVRAADADAAATMIANAVDLPGHAAVQRRPACELQPDSDLADRLVTTHVGTLTASEKKFALNRGCAHARALIEAGVIESAALRLGGMFRVVEREHGVLFARGSGSLARQMPTTGDNALEMVSGCY